MLPPSRIALAVAKPLFCALALCICLVITCLLLAQAHSGGRVAAQEISGTSPDPEPTEAVPPSENRGEEEDPSSDPPTSDQNNSSGDDVTVRIRR